MTKRILLTGVPGWLGDNLVESFHRSQEHGFSHLRCLIAPWTSQKSVEVLRTHYPRIEISVGDISDGSLLLDAVRDCHAIIHSAGLIHPKRPSDWYTVNEAGTVNLYQAATQAGVERFVFISSNAAGGRAPAGRTQRESDGSRPLSDYGWSKYRAEKAILSEGKIPSVVLRPCMFYGSPVPARHVEFFKRVQNGVVPVIGENLPRSMVHMSNLVDACWRALRSDRASGNIYNIADAEIYSIRQYVDTIANILGVNPRRLRLPSMMSTVAYWTDRAISASGKYHQNIHLLGEANWSVGLSIEAARKDLGYNPRFSLEDGLRESIDWCRARNLISL